VVVELNPNFEILSQMRNLTIQFLDNTGQCSEPWEVELKWNEVDAYECDCLDCTDFIQLLSTDLTIG
jgi:hypothetical protein